MTKRELLTAIKTRVRAIVWPTSVNKVFAQGDASGSGGSVVITSATEAEVLPNRRLPICMIVDMGGPVDPLHNEEPNLIRLQIILRIIVKVAGDAVGEHAIMGAGETAGATRSPGKGLTEVEEVVVAQMDLLSEQQGITIHWMGSANERTIKDDRLGHVAWIDNAYQAYVRRF